MKTRIILTVFLVLILLPVFHPVCSYAQRDEHSPGFYAVVDGEYKQLPYSSAPFFTFSLSFSFFGLTKTYQAQKYKNGVSGLDASDTFVLVINPDKIAGMTAPDHFDCYTMNMTPDNLALVPLLSFPDKDLRYYKLNPTWTIGPFSFREPSDAIGFDWKQISDNSFEIRVPGLIPGEYGFVTRMSPLSRFEIHSVFGFAVPGIAELDEIAGRYVDAATRISPFEAISLTDEEKMAKPDFLLDISAVDTLASDEQKINSLGFLLADYGVRTLFDMPAEEYRDVIKDLAREADYTVREYVARRGDYVLSDIFREHYEEYKVGYGVAVFWMIQSALLNETAYIIASDPDLFLNRISDEQADAFLTLLKCRDESFTVLGRRNDYMKSILSSTRLPMDDTIEKSKDYFITCRDSIISVRNSMLK